MNKLLTNTSARIGAAWNRFWFTPGDAFPLCALRIAVGLIGLYFVLSHTTDLARWFASDGMLPASSVRQLTGADESAWSLHPSYLYFVQSPVALGVVHGLGILVLVAMAIGLFTRLTTPLSLVVILSYVHRAPMITGHVEPLLTMLLFYLCLAPAGLCLSMDRLIARGNNDSRREMGQVANDAPITSTWATIAVRLIQIHLAGFYLMMGLTKLRGGTWWEGEAVWWLMAYTESRLVDLTSLHQATYLINAWTHAIVIFELSFALLIWNRTLRPFLLALSVVIWTSLALITGHLAFCAIMLVANLAFVPAETLRRAVSASVRPKSMSERSAEPA